MAVNISSIEAVFSEALEFSSAEARAAYLDGACAGDPELRRQVESLIDAHDRAGRFLASPTVSFEHGPAELVGSTVGPYKLLEQIGEGGMGVVYMAEQQKPVRRKVALKIIKPGMDTRQVIARFEAERQALALMEHPNIAHVLDAGATGSGRPYFVMELVKGIPITEYCDRNRLPIVDRLELFAQVCQAVQHAHQKGVIHRDLKPSNVLVTLIDGAAVPKVIDFGVAKAMGQQLTEKTLFTGFAQLIGTPLYMSPEQAEFSGVDVDTRSDIYALGVLLYELLTGTTPFNQETFRTAAYDEIRRIIREEEPPKPSTRISTLEAKAATVSANRKSDPRSLGRLMRGELDWIVMKALEKDRNRRYETASAFAADVQRYLDDEPVTACPPSAWYRFGKFARRNRVTLVTSALVVSALVLGTAVSTWQAVRATRAEGLARTRLVAEQTARREAGRLLGEVTLERNRADLARKDAETRRTEAEENLGLARRAVDDMYTQVARKWLAKQPKVEPLQREFLEKALAFYTVFSRRNSSDPNIQEETALAYRRVGDIQCELLQYPDAESAYRQAIAIQETLAATVPNRTDVRHELAHSHNQLGRLLLTTQRYPAAEQEFLHAGALFEVLHETDRTASEYRSDRAAVYEKLGLIQVRTGRLGDARKTLRQSIELQDRLVAEQPHRHDFQRELAGFYSNLGLILQDLGLFEEAEVAFRETIDRTRKLIGHDLGNPDDRRVLGGALHNLGRLLLSRGRQPAEVCQFVREAIDHQKAALAADPRNSQAREFLGNHYSLLSVALLKLGDHAQAARSAEELARTFPGNPVNATEAALILADCAERAQQDTRLSGPERQAAADSDIQRAKKLIRTTASLSQDNPVCLDGLAWFLASCGKSSLRDPALSLELAESAVSKQPGNRSIWASLGLAHYRMSHWDKAIQAIEKEITIAGNATTEDLFILAMAHHQRGDQQQAIREYQQAVATLEGVPVPPVLQDEAVRFRAEAAALLGLADLPADVFARPADVFARP
jgi:serine/threonine protein kinase/Tfp pilus assembly protein PilF